MEIMKNKLLYSSFITLLIFEIYACKQSGGGEEDKSTEYKAYNKDDNDYLNDEEFDQAVADSAYFEKWQRDSDQFLSEEEWNRGVNEHLGGYKVSTSEIWSVGSE